MAFFGHTGSQEADNTVTDRPVIVDILVDPEENCFPMIPAGQGHKEILLGSDDVQSASTVEGAGILV